MKRECCTLRESQDFSEETNSSKNLENYIRLIFSQIGAASIEDSFGDFLQKGIRTGNLEDLKAYVSIGKLEENTEAIAGHCKLSLPPYWFDSDCGLEGLKRGPE